MLININNRRGLSDYSGAQYPNVDQLSGAQYAGDQFTTANPNQYEFDLNQSGNSERLNEAIASI